MFDKPEEPQMAVVAAPPRTFRVEWSPEDGEYVATCDQFPSLSWLAPSSREALDGISALVAAL